MDPAIPKHGTRTQVRFVILFSNIFQREHRNNLMSETGYQAWAAEEQRQAMRDRDATAMRESLHMC